MVQAKWVCGKILQVEQATFISQNPSVKIWPCMRPIQAQRKKHGKQTAVMMHGWCLNIWGVSNPDIGQIIPIEPELVTLP